MQVSSLVAEVAAKQEQLQALEAEHEALTAKARALDQLVASAGEHWTVFVGPLGLRFASLAKQQYGTGPLCGVVRISFCG